MACLSYDHAVVYNSKFYPANTPIDVTTPEQTNEDAEEKAVKANANKRTSGKTKSANTTE